MRCGESSAFSFLVRWFLSLHSIKMQFAIRRKNRTAMFINSWGFRRRRAADFTPRFIAPAVIDVILIRHENHFFLRFSLNYFSFFAQKHKHSESTRFSTFIERWHQFRCRDKKEFSSFSHSLAVASKCQVSSASMNAIRLLTGIGWVDRLKVSTAGDYCDVLYWDLNSSDRHLNTNTASHSRATQAKNISDHPGNLCHPAESRVYSSRLKDRHSSAQRNRKLKYLLDIFVWFRESFFVNMWHQTTFFLLFAWIKDSAIPSADEIKVKDKSKDRLKSAKCFLRNPKH